MSEILKQYIKEILSEEIVTVSRGTDAKTYNVTFDKKDNIVRGSIVNIDDETDDLLQKAARLTTAPPGLILSKLSDPDIQVQQKARNPKQMEKILNAQWTDTLSWGSTNEKGRGEISLALAFERDESAKEPDFVSADGKIKISIKFFPSAGRERVRTGSADQNVKNAIEKLRDVLRKAPGAEFEDFPQKGSWSATQLAELLTKVQPRAKKRVIQEIRAALTVLKKACMFEHGAQGIMMCDDANGFYYSSDPDDIKPSSIRNAGTRVEFKGPYGTGETLEGVLDQ